jgi:hypothetical protein
MSSVSSMKAECSCFIASSVKLHWSILFCGNTEFCVELVGYLGLRPTRNHSQKTFYVDGRRIDSSLPPSIRRDGRPSDERGGDQRPHLNRATLVTLADWYPALNMSHRR